MNAVTELSQLAATLGEQPAGPPVPENLAETGLPESLLEDLVLKTLYYRGDTLGRDLSQALGLKFSVIEHIVEMQKREHLVAAKRSLGLGAVSTIYTLSDNGRIRAREVMESNQYVGRAPVPLEQYTKMVNQQRLKDSWLTMEALQDAFRHMVVTPQLLSMIGPAVNAGKSFLIYGPPGNGKTYLAEALFNLESEMIYVPHAIECQGMIIQVFDPVHHHPVVEQEHSSMAIAFESAHDRRWERCRRPFITIGGELAMDMLDLSYNPFSKLYDAPLQVKANNGIYLIDDFGRQKATPAEVLNRWIVPMERRIDYLSFQNGTKMHVPFECFLIFSSNLKPENLGDEAFLRRIQYKMLLKNPAEDEFTEIFLRFCKAKQLPCEPEMVDRFLEKHYRATGKPRRRCHPRDVLNHAVDLIRFERRPWELTEEVLEHAFGTCFVDTADEG